ncbi:MAG: hypothetical protein R6W91_07800 [Thermoplasmata archaeon]
MLESLQFGPDLEGFLVFEYTLCCLAYILIFVVWVYICIWVYRDAEKRGSSGTLWAILTFFFGLIPLIIWLIVRPPIKSRHSRARTGYMPPPPTPAHQPCPTCGRPMRVIPQYNRWYCDYCRKYP